MSTRTAGYTVAIVGGGAIGAALFDRLVQHVLEASPRTRPRIVLFEKSGRIGPGLAYARDASPLLLNQNAQTMSLVPGQRGHFCDWLAARGVARPEGDFFCERSLFGDYVEESFARALDRAKRHELLVSTVRDEVSGLAPRRFGGYRVLTREHPPLDADVVILAIGNLPSTRFRAVGGPGFVASPYPSAQMLARTPRGARVAVLGTGLSAIDATISLLASGHDGPVTMVSRSGLLPAVRGPLQAFELKHLTRAAVARATENGRRPLRWATVLQWLEAELSRHELTVSWDHDFPGWVEPLEHMAAQVAAAERGPRIWQSIGEALNPVIEVVWHHLADEDKRLFLDRFHARFMSHWVPIPLVTGRRLLALLRGDALTVERGLAGVTFDEAAGEYRLALPGRIAAFDCVVDATGVPRHLAECDSPLLRSLLVQGTIAPHPAGGLRVDFDSLRALGEDGRPDASLFAIGNLTSGTHLFTSTLELNVQKADRIAGLVVSELTRRSDQDHHADATPHST